MPHDVKNEKTGPQHGSVSIGMGIITAPNPLPKSYKTYRTMRKDPTIALARSLVVAPVVAGNWSIEADDEVDEERIKFIQDQFFGLREPFIETALFGGIDFGWQGFEKVYEEKDGQIVLRKLKPLYHDITGILVDSRTGAFVGFIQDEKVLPLANSLLIPFRVEGTQWYGNSLLENIRATQTQWTDANAGAAMYDKKLAGVTPVIEYPPEEEYVDDTKTPNKEIAKDVLDGLTAGKGVTIPRIPVPGGQGEVKNAWEIHLLADSTTRQPGFSNRLDYLDKLKVRGLEWPERAILEGMFGTKAEAGTHQGLALTRADLVHSHVTRLLNWHCVDQVLALNYGEDARGTIRLVPSPIVDAKLEFLREVFTEYLKNPNGFADLSADIDRDGLMDALGVPKSEEVVDDEEVGTPEQAVPGEDPNDPLAGSVREVFRDINGR